MKVLVLAESEKAARELCSGSRTLGDEVVLVVPGAPAITGVADRCIRIDIPEGNIVDDAYLTAIKIVDTESPQIVLGEPSIRILSIIGRLAEYIGTAAITDAIGISDGIGVSMYFGGVGVRKARATGPISIYTVGAGVFSDEAASGSDAIEEEPFIAPERAVTRVGAEPLAKSNVNLADADAIMAAGRGFAEKSELDLARELCAKIGAELGCTRPLTEGVDWMPRETYIGVSGIMLNPKVYISVGVSGQMQHMVGVNRAHSVFAINKDKNAPVFKQCDYGIVGDLKEILPALTAAL